jgi:hypothetical protein
MNYRRLNLFVQILEAFCSTISNFNSLVPIQNWTWFSPFYALPPCTIKLTNYESNYKKKMKLRNIMTGITM